MPKINFRRAPYRGILREIASEKGISVPAVSQAIRRRAPWVLPILRAKVMERRRIEQEWADVLAA
jgi:hypothetical protein